MRWTTLCNENDDDDDDTMAAVLSCDTFGWLRCFLVTHLDISRYSITAAYDVYIRAFVVSSCLPYPIPILRSCFGFDAILVTSRLSPTSLYRFTLAFSIRTVSLHPFNNHCTTCGHLLLRVAFGWLSNYRIERHLQYISHICRFRMLAVSHFLSQEMFWI